MQTLHTVLCLFILSATILLFGGCTNENEPDKSQITLEQLPSNARTYLTFLFPDKSPLKVEKADEPENVSYHFRATYADEVSIDFDEEGYWKNIHMPNGDVPEEIAERFETLYNYVTEVYKDNALVGITKTSYGELARLNDGQTLAFDLVEKYLGQELGVEGYKSLPNHIQELISMHFPEADYNHIIINPEAAETTIYKYWIWLDNKVSLLIDPQDEWVEINGNGQLLPQTLISILPERVQKELKDVQSIYRISIRNEGKEYHVWDSPSSSTLICTEEHPPINLNPKEIQAFIDEYFGAVTSKSVKVPAGHNAPLQYTVQLPNGFDFILGPQQLFLWSEVDGHGYPFLAMQEKLLPESALQYIAGNSEAKVTKARRLSDGYLLILTDGTALQFTFAGQFISRQEVTPTAYEKAYSYMRYQYPKDFSLLSSWSAKEGWTFRLDDGTLVKFDLEGMPKRPGSARTAPLK